MENFEVAREDRSEISILRLKGFSLHPIYCIYLGGYFRGVTQMLVKTPRLTFEETKCTFRGDEYHEYLIKWL